MNSDLFVSRRRARRFAQLLDEANGGRRHHVRSRVDEKLTDLVAVGHQVGDAAPTVEVSAEFRTGLRAMLLATAEREGLGRPAPAATTDQTEKRPAPHRSPLLPAVTARRARARGAILIGIATGAVAVSGISAASENAVPGDALYGMKRSTERAQLALTGSDHSRGQLFLDFARTRLSEAAQLRDDRAGYSGVLDDMDADTRQGVRLLTTAAVQASDRTALDVVDAFVAAQRTAVSELVGDRPRADRDRTEHSLALLGDALERSGALRAAIDCGLPAPNGSDTLGPTPASCPANR
ncbi:DUF5667 domain-containing protein [Salinispora pacifica]|uniref:DUF5667 domain-containing protein n=1 Tax=Salinispora pacifica TaxID=351187 RepID=UPI000365C634|nr:DUF5667 domain-containing protein [Salinispora pacifica]